MHYLKDFIFSSVFFKWEKINGMLNRSANQFFNVYTCTHTHPFVKLDSQNLICKYQKCNSVFPISLCMKLVLTENEGRRKDGEVALEKEMKRKRTSKDCFQHLA